MPTNLQKANIFFSTIIIGIISGCASLDYREIINLDRVVFEDLQLYPEVDPTELRVDIIRNTQSNYDLDSVLSTEIVPYHPFGFYIGNGIFYDLRGNLSLRVDYLLDFDSNYPFQLVKKIIKGRKKGNAKYSYIGDSLVYSYPPKEKIRLAYQKIEEQNRDVYRIKRRASYSILKSDSSLAYQWKNRKPILIYTLENNMYRVDGYRKKDPYKLHANEVTLGRDFFIEKARDNASINIYNRGRRKNKLRYTMEKSDSKLFIYDKKGNGFKIETKENSIEIYHGRRLICTYNLVLNKE